MPGIANALVKILGQGAAPKLAKMEINAVSHNATDLAVVAGKSTMNNLGRPRGPAPYSEYYINEERAAANELRFFIEDFIDDVRLGLRKALREFVDFFNELSIEAKKYILKLIKKVQDYLKPQRSISIPPLGKPIGKFVSKPILRPEDFGKKLNEALASFDIDELDVWEELRADLKLDSKEMGELVMAVPEEELNITLNAKPVEKIHLQK